MNIIIVGAGKVGAYLAQMLSRENHDVTIIDNDNERCKWASELLDVMVILGTGSSQEIQLQAGIKKCDMLIAVTGFDEANIVSCMLADRFEVPIKIARVRNQEFTDPDSALTAKQLGINLMIHPELETAREIVLLIRRASATDVLEFEKGRVQLVGLKVDRQTPLLNKKLIELNPGITNEVFRLVAIIRDNKTIIPTGHDVIRLRDQIFVIAETNAMPGLLHSFGKGDEKMENIMIMGGGKVGRLVAAELEKLRSANVKLVEANRDKTFLIADQLKRTLVIHGDGTNLDLMVQEGITEMDGYISVTEDEESNIISCLLAKHLGVKRTIAEVNRSDYLPLMGSIGIDAAVDRRMITANAILRFIRRGNVVSVGTVRGVEAEVIEVQITEKSQIANRRVAEIDFPEGAIIGCIDRDEKVIIPIGDTVIQALDKMIIFSLPKALPQVEKLFA